MDSFKKDTYMKLYSDLLDKIPSDRWDIEDFVNYVEPFLHIIRDLRIVW